MIGIDEVGRGCWAGPLLVVAARVASELPRGLTDSKLLSALRREKMIALLGTCCEFGEGWVSAEEIDEHGLSQAMKLGVDRALSALQASSAEEIIMDGSVNYIDPSYTNVRCLIKADLTVPIVSAASIHAKVTRDRYMQKMSEQYTHYGFEKHVGYGTALHRAMLELYGITPLHRRSFKPVGLYGNA